MDLCVFVTTTNTLSENSIDQNTHTHTCRESITRQQSSSNNVVCIFEWQFNKKSVDEKKGYSSTSDTYVRRNPFISE